MTNTKIYPTENDNYKPESGFTRVTYTQPHWARRKAIATAHPEVKQLPRNEITSVIWGIGYFTFMLGSAYAAQVYNFSYLSIAVYAYCIGAFASHSLWVLVHESTHDLVAYTPLQNTFMLLFANMLHLLPSGISFRYYHRIHHSHLNEAYGDPDMPLPIEAKIFGKSTLGKATWLCFFAVAQSLRVMAAPQPIEWALIANWTLNLSCGYLVATVWGMKAFTFLMLSSLFSVGFLLHPLAGRWIAEHWSAFPGAQETFSYYGSINKVAFDIGHHNEHHDFPYVPWTALAKVTDMAPEFYQPLHKHFSYAKLVWTFVTHPDFNLESRVARPGKSVAAAKKDAEKAE